MYESDEVHEKNSAGPRTEPCGTPNMREEEGEVECLPITYRLPSRGNDRNHWTAVERMPKRVLYFRAGKEELGVR